MANHTTPSEARSAALYAFASHCIHQQVKQYIVDKGYAFVEIPPLHSTYEAADAHADLYLHNLSGTLFYAPQAACLLTGLPASQPTEFPSITERSMAQIPDCCLAERQSSPAPSAREKVSAVTTFHEAGRLNPAYPGNIPLNAVSTKKYFIHNLKHTDPMLLQAAKTAGLTLVHVKQGYTKCNVAVVSENAFITSDAGIAKALAQHPCHVLQIRPGYVALPGLSAGFLGGACGLLAGELVINGDLNAHPDCRDILDFCQFHGVAARFFPSLPLVDIGSIITF